MQSTMPLALVQMAGHCLLGAHLQMCSYHGCCTHKCSYHGCCTHNDPCCGAQHPNSTSPTKAAATDASCCYFCRMRAHLTDWCDRPCPQRQPGCFVPTHGGYTGTSSPFCCPRTAAWNSNGLSAGGHQLNGINESDRFLIHHQRDVGHVVNGFGEEISSPPLGATQQAANVVLSAPAALPILGPEVTQRALQFIVDSTIRATPVHKILLDGELLLIAVDTFHHTVEQARHNAQPPAVVALLPSTMTTGAQMLVVTAQQQPEAAVAS
uniref:Uncharacterized protein n=1 Tax=Romanomermis culicivorax TaxID=13658 RepID=A0A915KHM5_ROMCU